MIFENVEFDKDGNAIQTTIGQLNFFKWALENEVITFIEQNYSSIEKDMNSTDIINQMKDQRSLLEQEKKILLDQIAKVNKQLRKEKKLLTIP